MRFVKIVLGVLVVLIAVPAVLFGLMIFHNGKLQDAERLGDLGTVVKDGIVGLDVIELAPGKLALIDVGTDPQGKAILAELARRQLGNDAVAAIFFTHGHPDHIAAAHLFPSAQLYALEAEVPLIEGKVGAKGPIPRLFGVHPTNLVVQHPLHDGDVVTLGERKFEVFALPGHTAGSAAYLVSGVLFLGDSADATRDGQVQAAKWVVSDDTEVNQVALKSLAVRLKPRADEIKRLVFSHSGTLPGFGPLGAYADAH